jgi:alpha-methylacyl-CoA racemase
MIDGSATLMTMMYGLSAIGAWKDERGTNALDTGAPYYDTYETKDGKFIALGALEAQFYAEFNARTGLDQEDLPAQNDQAGYPTLRARYTELFKTKTRDEWDAILEMTDACYAPVLTMSEAAQHPHMKARNVIVTGEEGVAQPAPAPRFSRTPGAIQRPAPNPGQHTDEALLDWGFTKADVARLIEAGAIK